LKKIFKDFKSETLRKYWKIIRQTGDNDKFIEVVKQNEKFINNPVLRLLPIINTISSYIITPPKNQNFEDYFISINPKEMKELQKIEPIPEKKEKKQKIKKIEKIEKIEKEENEKEQIDPKILEMGNTIEKLMKMTNSTEENVLRALYGCTGDVKNAYLFLKDNKKYEKYFFFHTDDYIIKNLKNKNYYLDLLNKKGEDNVKIREKFLKKK
jgi:NACalpha-BTF3-like transcription factor